jgi:hypothetical protein
MTQLKHESGPGEKGWEEHEVKGIRDLADSLEPCLAIHVDAVTNWTTRPPQGCIWTTDLLRPLRVPSDWERAVLEHWPPLVKKKITPDRAIGCLRLEIEENYAPKYAEEEWNRRNAPRRSRWERERGRIVRIVERVQLQRERQSRRQGCLVPMRMESRFGTDAQPPLRSDLD